MPTAAPKPKATSRLRPEDERIAPDGRARRHNSQVLVEVLPYNPAWSMADVTAASDPVEARTAIPRSSVLALRVLIGIAVVSPWAFGSVQPWAMATIAGIALLVVVAGSADAAMTEGIVLPGLALWPLTGFAALGLFQLAPLPPILHRLIAPGSYAVWHPLNAAA